ncbi:hypothetical protein [Hymenobacter rubripertinctus]|nr:hypothetical protein [Hymenobacter rubripertinctus]
METLLEQLHACPNTSPLTRLVAMSQGLLRFAGSCPDSFDQLFQADAGRHSASTAEKEMAAVGQLIQARFVVAVQQQVGPAPQAPHATDMLATLVWYFLYGLALKQRVEKENNHQNENSAEMLLFSFLGLLKHAT